MKEKATVFSPRWGHCLPTDYTSLFGIECGKKITIMVSPLKVKHVLVVLLLSIFCLLSILFLSISYRLDNMLGTAETNVKKLSLSYGRYL